MIEKIGNTIKYKNYSNKDFSIVVSGVEQRRKNDKKKSAIEYVKFPFFYWNLQYKIYLKKVGCISCHSQQQRNVVNFKDKAWFWGTASSCKPFFRITSITQILSLTLKFPKKKNKLQTCWSDFSPIKLPSEVPSFGEEERIKKEVGEYLKVVLSNKQLVEKNLVLHSFFGSNVVLSELLSYLSTPSLEGEVTIKKIKPEKGKKNSIWLSLKNRFLFLHSQKTKTNPFQVIPVDGCIIVPQEKEGKNEFVLIVNVRKENGGFSQQQLLISPSNSPNSPSSSQWIQAIQQMNLNYSNNFKKVSAILQVAG